MKRALLSISLVFVAALAATGCGRKTTESSSVATADSQAAKLERGRHIVEGLGMCHDCHTAVLPDGQPDRANALMGATLPFRPTIDIPWAEVAPQIAGLPTMTDEQAMHFFMTGERPGGVPPRPPMPRYAMSHEEADAVVAYLRSLTPKG